MRFIGFILFAIIGNVYSQTRSSTFCDCGKAKKLVVSDTLIIGPTNAPKGGGKEEINFVDKASSFEKEHNTAWYVISIKKCGILSFTVTPEKKTDDYDFMLFKADSINACELIKESKLFAIRSNIGRNDSSGVGLTGLNDGAKNKFEAKGPKATFSKSLDVKAGENYILVLDNVYENGKGHTLKFINAEFNYFVSNVYDYYSGKPFRADHFFSDTTGYFCMVEWGDLNYDTRVKLNIPWKGCPQMPKFLFSGVRVAMKGYLSEFIPVEEMKCENNNLKTYVRKIFKDSSYVFKNIFFEKDLSVNAITSKIYLVMYNEFLRKNTKVSIVITGIMSANIKSQEDFIKAANNLKRKLCLNGVMESRIKILWESAPLAIGENQVIFKVL